MQTQRVQLSDIELAYLSWGDPASPPLLLLHGYLDVADVWNEVATQLARDFFVVAPHFRGHGDSGWGDGFAYLMPNYLLDLTELVEGL